MLIQLGAPVALTAAASVFFALEDVDWFLVGRLMAPPVRPSVMASFRRVRGTSQPPVVRLDFQGKFESLETGTVAGNADDAAYL